MEQQHHNDEIDLLELFNNLLKSIYFFFNRWYITLAIITFIGLLLGSAIYFKDRKTYQNNMIGTSRYIQPVLIVDIINSLSGVNKSDKESFQRSLGLPIEDIKNIASFHADTIETLKGNITTIKIVLTYNDSINVNSFTDRLVNYINENEYIKRELGIVKRRNEALIKKTDYEMSKLDSLQKNILNSSLKTSRVNPSSLVITNDQVNKFFHEDMIKLENAKQGYLNNLERLTGFEIINRFEPAKIKERSLIKTLVIFAAIAFGIGFFVLLGIEIRRKAIQLIKK
ncbi:MAG: hypothetical protein DRI95_05620 [Bacteroidetes bacterium]|nr:MAG: hypothetical protein DRI95_05620 [Bacteroidota bacterium]